MPIILKATVRIEKKSNTPNIEVHLMAISNSKYHIYATKPSQISIPSHCLKIYI